MNFEKKKNILTIISAIFLFLAMLDSWPYGFFTLLRFVVFATMAYIAWVAYELKREKWIWIFGFLAVIFNPFIPLYFGREFWVIVDFIVAVFLVVSIFIFKIPKKFEDLKH
jgi:hypothetical protein